MRKTILGADLRALSRTLVNSLSSGKQCPVIFRGTGAFTTGKVVSLPKINDLAEIEWPIANGLLGYAVHEVAHVRDTDFTEVARSYKEGERVRHFANAIEDYRIERNMVRTFRGTREDLTHLRRAVHPKPDFHPPRWYADPRACGPLALTWTGSQLNQFVIPEMAATMAMFPPPVRAMLDRWTAKMEHITSTREAVDLAIEFVKEADAYAAAMQAAADASSDNQDSNHHSGDDARSTDDGDSQSHSQDGSNGDQPDRSGSNQQNPSGNDAPHQPDENGNPNADDEQDDQAADQDGNDPFNNALSPDADLEDIIDSLRQMIADSVRDTGAPDLDVTSDDGEINPDDITDKINSANASAPDYDTSESETQNPGGQSQHNVYNQTGIVPAPVTGSGEYLAQLTQISAGATATTSRIIQRLLMASEHKGTLRNRRDGQFDIRNIQAIIRNSGTVYKKTFERPSPRTLLTTLIDFSRSMHGDAINLAMTSALTLYKATQNTPVTNWIYGFTGYSPNVTLTEFSNGKDNQHAVLRRIDSAPDVTMACTPTGEAMSYLIRKMDDADQERRVLLIITDGQADDVDLCASVAKLATRRGIEVIAIGIGCPAVSGWAPVYEVINDISKLPAALMATIDPRQNRPIAA